MHCWLSDTNVALGPHKQQLPPGWRGRATATVRRADFGLTIPSVPQVAGVSEDVLLEFDFTAVRNG